MRAFLRTWYGGLPVVQDGHIGLVRGPGLGVHVREGLAERPDVQRRTTPPVALGLKAYPTPAHTAVGRMGDTGRGAGVMVQLLQQQHRYRSQPRMLWLGVGAAFLLVAIASVFAAPNILVPTKGFDKDIQQLRLANRLALLQGLAGLAVFVGALAAWRQLQLGREQLRVSQQGQITERFTRAIDQLGNESEDVRLGGVYALEQISKTSPTERAAIYEILSAYVRGHSPWPPLEPRPSSQPPTDADLNSIPRLHARLPAVQAAMIVLARRLPTSEPLPLMGADLRRVRLYGAHLQGGAKLQGVLFSGSHLGLAGLEGADLRGASLRGTRLDRANLKGANLYGAHLEEATLVDADLEGANLTNANLAAANLHGANLTGASLDGAHLEEANASPSTLWPNDFNWKNAKVRMRP